jgi:hypothetical protein
MGRGVLSALLKNVLYKMTLLRPRATPVSDLAKGSTFPARRHFPLCGGIQRRFRGAGDLPSPSELKLNPGSEEAT